MKKGGALKGLGKFFKDIKLEEENEIEKVREGFAKKVQCEAAKVLIGKKAIISGWDEDPWDIIAVEEAYSASKGICLVLNSDKNTTGKKRTHFVKDVSDIKFV